MVLYFVSKLKLISNKPAKKHIEKNKVTLLSYSTNDSEGWELVKREAKNYMTKKNGEMCDQTKTREGENVKIMYVIRESRHSDDKINTIEVYKQWQDKIKGYLGSTYKDRELKVAEFSLTKFTKDIECLYCQTGVYVKPTPKNELKTIATAISNMNPLMLKELKDNNMFLERIKQVEKYSTRYDNDMCSMESVESE